jgi:predicted DNA-binding WGR domain protein
VVTGRINEGKVIPLTEEDVDECKRWGFQYKLPEDDSDSEAEIEVVEEVVEVTDDESEPAKVYLVADSSSGGKFWEATVDGSTFTTRYGKVGSNGTSKSKELSDNDAALKHLEKERKKKEKKGYVQQSETVETVADADDESSDSEDEKPVVKSTPKTKKPTRKTSRKASRKASKTKPTVEDDSSDSEDEAPPQKRKTSTKKSLKAQEPESSDDDLEDELGDSEPEHAQKFISKALGVEVDSEDSEDSDVEELEEDLSSEE